MGGGSQAENPTKLHRGEKEMEHLEFKPFTESHLSIYESWFVDSELSRRIEKPTRRWLNYILSDPRARSWVVFKDEELVGVVQVDEETNGYGSVCVVVKPPVRNQGYGRSILKWVLGNPELGYLVRFEGYVEPDNIAAQKCCEAAGFHLGYSDPDEEGFLKFVYP